MPAEPSGISEKWQRGCLLLRAFCKVLALAGVSAFWLATPVNRKVDGSFTDMTPKNRVTRFKSINAEDLEHEQTDRCSRRWPVRNGCICTSLGSGSDRSGSSFEHRSQVDAQEVDGSQEVAQEGRYRCCCFVGFGISLLRGAVRRFEKPRCIVA
jgi:hypothetical protein